MRKLRGVLGIVLSVIMVLSLVPTVAYADNSEKFTVAPETDVIINGGFLKGLDPEDNTLAAVKTLFVNEADKITAFNGDDALSDSDRIGTGSVIRLSADKDSLIAILYGDVTGDGFITDTDYTLIEKEAVCSEDAIADGSVYEKAADVNNDSVIDAFDLSFVDLQVASLRDIDQRGDLPEAVLTAIDTDSVGTNGVVNVDGRDITVDTALMLDATQTVDEIEYKEYKDWNVDIVISFNKDVDGSKVYLLGQYGDYDWRGGALSDEIISAGTKFSVVNGWLGETLTYEDVLTVVGNMKTAMYAEDAPAGLKVTVDLVMTDTESDDDYIVSTYTYTFTDNLPEAVIEEIDSTEIGAGGDGALTGAVTGDSVRADAGLRLSTDDTPADIIGAGYRFWTVDILVSFDRNVNGNDVYFFGDYGDYEWVGDKLAVVPAFDGTIPAGTEIALIKDWISSVIGSEVLVTYDEIVKLVHSMETAVSVPNAEDGLKLTAKLVMTDNETGDEYTVDVLNYTFDRYLPEAVVEQVPANTVGEYNDGFLNGYVSGDVVESDIALSFTSKETPEEVEGKNCLDYAVDFEVSFDRDVNGNDVYLFGNYGIYGWTGDKLAVVPDFDGTIAANTKIGIVEDLVGPTIKSLYPSGSVNPIVITYGYILTEVGEMKTALHINNPEEGLTVTVDLVMTDLATGNRYVVSTYTYTYITPELPDKSDVTMAPLSKGTIGNNGTIPYGDVTVTPDIAIGYKAIETSASIADKEYKDWNVDFLIHFNKDVDGSKVLFFSRYGSYGWMGSILSDGTVESGRRIALMKDWRGETLTYSDLVELKQFDWAFHIVDPEAGLRISIDLVMTDPATGRRYVIRDYSHSYK